MELKNQTAYIVSLNPSAIAINLTTLFISTALGLSLDSVELSKDQKSLSRDSGLTMSEDDRDSPGLNNFHGASFHRSDWTRQAARVRSMHESTWMEVDEAFCASNESLCGPPVPPRRPPPLRHLPPVHLPPIYRPPPPPPPTYATARLLLVTDAESESYVWVRSELGRGWFCLRIDGVLSFKN